MKTLHVTLVPSERAGTSLTPVDADHEQLVEALTTYKTGEKDGHAIIPARFRPCPEECRFHGIPKRMDCGGGKLHRMNDNVLAMTALGVDIDGVTKNVMDDLIDGLQQRQRAFFYWETYSSESPSDVRARFLIPFTQEMVLPSVEAWKKYAWPHLMRKFGMLDYTDASCSDPCRVYYTPRKPTAQHERNAFYWGP